MHLPPLHRATLLRRYKRFLADVRFEDGREETVHCPNPGAMLGLAAPGLTVWTSRGLSRTRKLPHTWELAQADGGLVGVNTHLPHVTTRLESCFRKRIGNDPRLCLYQVFLR